MNQRQAVAYIGAYLWRRERLGMLFSLLFAVYLGVINSTTIGGLLAGDENIPRALNGLVDWLNMVMYPIFGMVMNKSAWGMWRDNYYSKRIAQWRTMPIPVASIVWARMLQSAVMLPVIGGIYLLAQYLFTPGLREYVTPMQWIENGLIWMCYGVAVLSLIILMELGYTGKQYCLMYFGMMVAVAAIAIILTWQGVYVFRSVLDIIKDGYGPAVLIGMAVLAAVATAAGHQLTVARIRARSLPL
ncbi:hypothetical protein [Cohnella sp.]|uniref:hypothetical protein n=1 Tax=Cohnella sp. TaxID=1883426 RepID=UPI00356A868C